MKIALGSDHAGFELKRILQPHIKKWGHSIIDLGPDSAEPVDYPDYAERVALAVSRGDADRGIMLCGSGVGAGIASNKVPGARAAVCHDTFSAHQGVEDDDMNVLCLGARVIGFELAVEIVNTWLSARFSGAERHKRRLEKVLAIERRYAATASTPARRKAN